MTNARNDVRSILRRIINSTAVLVIAVLPLTVTLQANADPCTPPADSGPGVHHPVGADANLYTYNCDSHLWVSPHYTYNPVTGAYTASDPVVYTYNPNTGTYDYTVWQFSAPAGSYLAMTKSTANPPAGANVVGAPAAPTSSGNGDTNSISNTGDGSNNNINDNGGVTDGSSISNTGANSNNNIDGSANNNTNANNNTGVNVNNQLTATASSGNATVLGNTTAGDAASGDATDIANIENMLQSASNALGGDAVTFVANIDGDVNGDLLLDPSTISNVQPANAQSGTNTTNINNNSNESINNNIDLSADSGDANVSENTTAGNANSGAAKTIANVVNVIDSAITSGHSFLGVININGDLNGDILMPSDFVDQLLAANVPTVNIVANTGAGSNNSITDNSGSNNTTVNNNNAQNVANNVNATATTGSANVSENTSAGGATTGTATTNITAFNLTGSSVIGKNDLLVFVNVVGGKWVGLIVDAPPGATAAELGGGIVSGGGNANNNTTVNNNDNQTITNNLNLNSKSGNASVDRNTTAGNATSGNADDAVNLLNVENSNLALSNWFGILFINVFGTWNGSFGVNTAAGDPIVNGGMNMPGSFETTPTFKFAPKTSSNSVSKASSGNFNSTFGSISGTGSGSSNGISTASSVLAAIKNKNSVTPHSVVNTPGHVNWSLVGGSIGFMFVYLLGERFYAVRQRGRLRT